MRRLIIHCAWNDVPRINYKLALNNSVLQRICEKREGSLIEMAPKHYRNITEKVRYFPDSIDSINSKKTPFIYIARVGDSTWQGKKRQTFPVMPSCIRGRMMFEQNLAKEEVIRHE